jgi:RNA polymerase sigma factor (TIGR02999 family)
MCALPQEQPITVLLHDLAAGDKRALDSLIPLLYPELKKLAQIYMRNERSSRTLQPTALVHEAYARLVEQDHPDYRSRAHFMGVAAHLMRQILVDHARTRDAAKRGGGADVLPMEDAYGVGVSRPAAMVAIDDALAELARTDPTKAKLVEMRFFGGLTAEESAEVLGIPVASVRNHLRVGQAWLRKELDRTAGDEEKS